MVLTRNRTTREGRLLAAVRSIMEARKRPPTMRELQEETGFSSTSVVSHYLNRLEAAGAIRRSRETARSIELVDGPCPYCGGHG